MAPVYFFLFAAIGGMSPYLSVYYKQMGLSGTEISMLLSVAPVLLFISQPIFGPLTDRSGHRGKMLAKLLMVAAFTGGLLALGHSFLTLLPLVILWSFTSGLLGPIADSIALGEVVRTGVSYPQLRLWGSIGFLVATIGLGRLYNGIGLRWAFGFYLLFNVIAWYFSRRLPAEGVSRQQPVWPELRRLLSNKFLIAFLLLSAVIQLTQGAHSAFFSVHMMNVGGSSSMVGLAWGLAALTEVPMFLILGRITRRTGPLPLLAVAGGVFSLRWFLYSMATSPGMLVALQLLQAFSFAIFMPTAVVVVGELSPPDLKTTGQSLLVLTNSGLATVIGTLVSGRIVDRVGTAGLYQIMSGVALVAGLGYLLLLIVRRLRAREAVSRG